MTSNKALLVLIAILVGLGIGYVIWNEGEEPQPLAGWTSEPCPPPAGATIETKLNEITAIVLALPLKDVTVDAVYCGIKAQQLQLVTITMPWADAAAKVKAAHDAANKKDGVTGLPTPDWGTCRTELDGIH